MVVQGSVYFGASSVRKTSLRAQVQAQPRRQAVASSVASSFPLEGIKLLNTEGAEVPLPAWDEEETTVFALLRHFG